MDDPGWSWPAWKFGMKRSDLFTSLHDQYNTFTFNIQDPEAFHHDVYEISRDADTSDEFHRLMAARQQQRLRELNESLESLAVEIIANPKLMETDQWQHALQLFRTKSFDSIVRYFASYLPDHYLERHNDARSTCSSFSETDSVHTVSTKASSVDDAVCSILDPECTFNHPPMTEEPCELDSDTTFNPVVQAPPSPPESEVVVLESASADVEAVAYRTNPRPRSLSFSPAESEFFGSDMLRPIVLHDDDDSSQYDRESTVTSVSDCTESRSSLDPVDDKEHLPIIEIPDDDDDDIPTAQHPEDDFDIITTDSQDTLESDTPTPRQETSASCYLEHKSSASRRLPSPTRRSPSSRSQMFHREGGSPMQDIRRSPEEAFSRIQKSVPDASGRRLRSRRRLEALD